MVTVVLERARDIPEPPPDVAGIYPQPMTNHRLDQMNSYFRLKAAEVFNDEASVRLLARLYESHALAYRDLPINETNGVALARLTAAGFCEVGPLRARITDDGQRFIDNIHQE